MAEQAKYLQKLALTKVRKSEGRLQLKLEQAREALYEESRMTAADLRGREEQVRELRAVCRKRTTTLGAATDEVDALRSTADRLHAESTGHATRRMVAEEALETATSLSKKHKATLECYLACQNSAVLKNPVLLRANDQLTGQLAEWTSWWGRLHAPVRHRLLHAPPNSKDKRFNPDSEHFGDALACDGWA
jgi:hypothetical protein